MEKKTKKKTVLRLVAMGKQGFSFRQFHIIYLPLCSLSQGEKWIQQEEVEFLALYFPIPSSPLTALAQKIAVVFQTNKKAMCETILNQRNASLQPLHLRFPHQFYLLKSIDKLENVIMAHLPTLYAWIVDNNRCDNLSVILSKCALG